MSAVPLSNCNKNANSKVSTIERLDGLRIFKIRANTSIDPSTGKKYLAVDKSNELKKWISRKPSKKCIYQICWFR